MQEKFVEGDAFINHWLTAGEKLRAPHALLSIFLTFHHGDEGFWSEK